MKYLKKEEVGQRGQKFSFYPFKIRCTQELTLLNFFFFFPLNCNKEKKIRIRYLTKCTILTCEMVNRGSD